MSVQFSEMTMTEYGSIIVFEKFAARRLDGAD